MSSCSDLTVLSASGLRHDFAARIGGRVQTLRAVDDVTFTIGEGECFGLIGESGSGKSTISRIAAGLLAPTAGSVMLGETAITGLSPRKFAASPLRSAIQIVFQDPDTSLNPCMTVTQAIAGPLRQLKRLSGRVLSDRIREAAEWAGLPIGLLDRLPHELSGGQKARVGIARAIAPLPRLLVLDEPTAALDVSVQATIIRLLADLRERLGMSYLFVSHDLAVVRLLADRVGVMHRGRMVECGGTEEVIGHPQDPYTRSLMASIRRRVGAVPDPAATRPVLLGSEAEGASGRHDDDR